MRQLALDVLIMWRHQARFITIAVVIGALVPWASTPVGLVLPFVGEVLVPLFLAYLASHAFTVDMQSLAGELALPTPRPVWWRLGRRIVGIFALWLTLQLICVVPCAIVADAPLALLLLSSLASTLLLCSLTATGGLVFRSSAGGVALALAVVAVDRLLVGAIPPSVSLAPITIGAQAGGWTGVLVSRFIFMSVSLVLLGAGMTEALVRRRTLSH